VEICPINHLIKIILTMVKQVHVPVAVVICPMGHP
jgi:hypothetical protein